MGKNERKLSAEELRLWRQAVGDDEPGGEPSDAPESGPGSDGQRPTATNRPRRSKGGAPAPGRLGKHETRAIRRGTLAIDDRIDLHGMTQANAHGALAAFIRDGAERGLRCVLVITGKGGGPVVDDGAFAPRRTGVLRTAVPQWLAEPDLAAHVIGLQTALPRDGGAGALYVLLRKANHRQAP